MDSIIVARVLDDGIGVAGCVFCFILLLSGWWWRTLPVSGRKSVGTGTVLEIGFVPSLVKLGIKWAS